LSAKVYDPDGDIVSVDWSAPGVGLSADSGQGVTGQFPMGESVVEAHATDGLLEQSDRVSVTVVDMTPPSFTSVVATPACLWPPKHKYVAFELGKNVLAQVSDHCDQLVSARVVGVDSDEPDDGLGDGDTARDVVRHGNRLCLRAERSGRGQGRTYTIQLEAVDASGNRAMYALPIVVPHDERSHCEPLAESLFLEDDDPACGPDSTAALNGLPGSSDNTGRKQLGIEGSFSGCGVTGAGGDCLFGIVALLALIRRRRS
jgi:hypothetical protein